MGKLCQNIEMGSLDNQSEFSPTSLCFSFVDTQDIKPEEVVAEKALKQLLTNPKITLPELYAAIKERYLKITKIQSQLEIKEIQKRNTLSPAQRQKIQLKHKELQHEIHLLESHLDKLAGRYRINSLNKCSKNLKTLFERVSSLNQQELVSHQDIKNLQLDFKRLRELLKKTYSGPSALKKRHGEPLSLYVQSLLEYLDGIQRAENKEIKDASIIEENAAILGVEIRLLQAFRKQLLLSFTHYFELLNKSSIPIKNIEYTKPVQSSISGLKKTNNISQNRSQVFQLKRIVARTRDPQKIEQLNKKIEQLESMVTKTKQNSHKQILTKAVERLKLIEVKFQSFHERLERIKLQKMLSMMIVELGRMKDSAQKELKFLQKMLPVELKSPLLEELFLNQFNKFARIGVSDFETYFSLAQDKEKNWLTQLEKDSIQGPLLLLWKRLTQHVNQIIIQSIKFEEMIEYRAKILEEQQQTKMIKRKKTHIKSIREKIEKLESQLIEASSMKEFKQIEKLIHQEQNQLMKGL